MGSDKSSEIVIAVIEHIDRRLSQFEDRLAPRLDEMEKDIKCLQKESVEAKIEKKWMLKVSATAGSLVSFGISLLVSNWQSILAVISNKKG